LQKNNIPAIDQLLQSEPERLDEMCRTGERWRLDVARVPVGLSRWQAAFDTAALADVGKALDDLFQGRMVNVSEHRPALHMAYRAPDPSSLLSGSDLALVSAGRASMLDTARELFEGRSPVRVLLHVGIGGSDLGPRLVAGALDSGRSAVRVEWLTTLDSRRIRRLLEELDPATTGMVIASKSFSTVETLEQAAVIREWLGRGMEQRCWAATANPQKALEFGIAPSRILAFPEWLGGRFSLWSGIGLSAAARIGPDQWQAMLGGAADADQAIRRAPRQSPALVLARAFDLLVRDLGFNTLGVVSYEPGLRLLSEFLQQLIMESLGKSVTSKGLPVDGPTSPLVFGGAGTDLQHSLFQALHQGTTRHPMLLLGTLECDETLAGWQDEQLANLLGQASVLARGRAADDGHRRLPGNNPVMILLARRLDAAAVGELLANLEHAVYLMGHFWKINPFDQWGVEEGKRLAGAFGQALRGRCDCPDRSFDNTLEWVAGKRKF